MYGSKSLASRRDVTQCDFGAHHHGSIKPKVLTSRRDVTQCDFGAHHQYYNNICNGKEEALSDTDFYSLSDEDPPAAPPVYSVVQKKRVETTAEQKYLFIEAKIDNNLPGWLRTSSLNRCWRTPLKSSSFSEHNQEKKEVVVAKNIAPPPPPPRGKRNSLMMNKKPSWRLQYGSTSSSLGSAGTTSHSVTPSPQLSKLPYKKTNNGNDGSVRRPTNFDHHPIKCFADSIWRKTSKAFQGSSSTSNRTPSHGPVKKSNENVQRFKTNSSNMQEKENNLPSINSPYGSNTSINSIWTEDGRLITPPPRRRSQSRQSLSKITNTDDPFELSIASTSASIGWQNNPLKNTVPTSRSNGSLNRILTSSGLLTPPERIKSKMHFGSIGQINHNVGGANTPITFAGGSFHFPSKSQSNDTINRVKTPNGIITPPPRRCFNRSMLSLQNQVNNDHSNRSQQNQNEKHNFVPMTISQSGEFGYRNGSTNEVRLKMPNALAIHSAPVVSTS